MSNDSVRAAPKLPRNELARAVIAVPTDATIYGGTQYIAVVWDHWYTTLLGGFEISRPSILGPAGNTLPYLTDYRLIDLLCSDRAMCTVDGKLRVLDRQFSPEDYLGLWRYALKHPRSADWLASEHNLRILITLEAALEPARAARCGWSGSPFPTFAEFEAAHGQRFVLSDARDGAQRFELVLDLREPTAARDAFYAGSLLRDREDAGGVVSVSLSSTAEAQGGRVQGLLFERSLS